jgi:hypothetical protein
MTETLMRVCAILAIVSGVGSALLYAVADDLPSRRSLIVWCLGAAVWAFVAFMHAGVRP